MTKSWIFAALIPLALPLLAGSTALARTPFDGSWSVSIITNAGACDRGYRYRLNIENGQISYDDPGVQVSGQVTPRGQVQVTVRAGSQQAVGSGRLSRDYGEGRWSGLSSAGQCSGVWQAEREG